jgi:hypothetical protein
VELCDVTSLLPLVVVVCSLAGRNVAYNAVCLLQKLVQIIETEGVGLDWVRIVLDQYLVEYGRDVHCCARHMQRVGVGGMTMLAAGV